jgi:anti-sigma B factor antagonist
MLLRIDSSHHEDTCVLSASGEIDIDTVDLLRSAVTDALRADCRHLVVDLNQASYIDSAGLGVLVGTYKRLEASQGSLTVRCREPRVLRLFAITGLTDLFHIDMSVPEPRTPAVEVTDAVTV